MAPRMLSVNLLNATLLRVTLLGVILISVIILSVTLLGVYHPLDGATNAKYKLLHFFTTNYFFQKDEDTSF